MNKGRISIQVLLYFLIMMFLMVIGCSKSDDTLLTTTTGTFTQADLTGTWRINFLTTGSANRWFRALATSDSSGLLTSSDCLDSTGDTTCPAAGSIQWTINGSGVISESGVNGSPDAHYTMTANKNFIAGTSTEGPGQYDLRIAQKVVPGTVYSNADLQSKSFAYHQLEGGSNPGWSYGAGTTDASGLVIISSETDSWGNNNGTGSVGTLSVDSAGVVTMNNDTSFQGFLSDDKKTIVVTNNSGGTPPSPQLMILQITGQTYTAGPIPAGTWASYTLACGAVPAPFWLHYTLTVDSGGVGTLSNFVSSSASVIPTGGTITGHISSSGTVTIDGDSSYHGQVSDDGKFLVYTDTLFSGIYSLSVVTR